MLLVGEDSPDELISGMVSSVLLGLSSARALSSSDTSLMHQLDSATDISRPSLMPDNPAILYVSDTRGAGMTFSVVYIFEKVFASGRVNNDSSKRLVMFVYCESILPNPGESSPSVMSSIAGKSFLSSNTDQFSMKKELR